MTEEMYFYSSDKSSIVLVEDKTPLESVLKDREKDYTLTIGLPNDYDYCDEPPLMVHIEYFNTKDQSPPSEAIPFNRGTKLSDVRSELKRKLERHVILTDEIDEMRFYTS